MIKPFLNDTFHPNQSVGCFSIVWHQVLLPTIIRGEFVIPWRWLYGRRAAELLLRIERPLFQTRCTTVRIRALASARGSVARRAQIKDQGESHSRARRAREWLKPASPRARGRAKPSACFGACQCYYMFFTIQPKIAIFVAQFKYLNDGQYA